MRKEPESLVSFTLYLDTNCHLFYIRSPLAVSLVPTWMSSSCHGWQSEGQVSLGNLFLTPRIWAVDNRSGTIPSRREQPTTTIVHFLWMGVVLIFLAFEVDGLASCPTGLGQGCSISAGPQGVDVGPSLALLAEWKWHGTWYCWTGLASLFPPMASEGWAPLVWATSLPIPGLHICFSPE